MESTGKADYERLMGTGETYDPKADYERLMGTSTPTPVQPAGTPGVQQGRWQITIQPPGAPPDSVEVPGTWQDATATIAALRQQFHPQTQFGIAPVPTEASPWQPEPSDRRLASGRFQVAPQGTTAELQRRDVPYATSATPEAYGPGAAGAFSQYRGKPDLPLEKTQSPIDLAVDAYTLGLGASGGKELARWLAPKAGKLLTLGAEGLGLEAAHKVNQATGTTPGPVMPGRWSDVVPDVMNLTIPYGAEALRMAKSGAIRYSRAGEALTTADAANAKAAADAAAANQAAAAKAAATNVQAAAKAEADTAAGEAAYRKKAADYAAKTVMTRNETVQANEAAEAAFQAKKAKAIADADAATKAQAELHTATTKDDYDAAWAKWEKSQADYRTSKAAYDDAVQSQGAAVARARDLVQQMKPETPAWVHYQNLAETAPKAPVDIDEVKALSSSLRSEVTSPQTAMPSRLETIMTDLESQPSTIPLGQVHENYLKELGPLTRSADPQTRRVSKQLIAGLQDAMETSAGLDPATQAALPLLRKASATARKEFAVDDLNDMVLASTGLKGGKRVIRADALVKRFEDAVANRGGKYPLFKGSFTPEELDTLHGDLMALTQTPSIPGRVPTAPPPFVAPTSEPPPGPVAVKDIGAAPIPTDPQLAAKLKHGGPPIRPEPIRPTVVTPESVTPDIVLPEVKGSGGLLKINELFGGGILGYLHSGGLGSLKAAAGALTIDALHTGLARLLVSRPGAAQWLRSQMSTDGTLSPQALGVLSAFGQETMPAPASAR